MATVLAAWWPTLVAWWIGFTLVVAAVGTILVTSVFGAVAAVRRWRLRRG